MLVLICAGGTDNVLMALVMPLNGAFIAPKFSIAPSMMHSNVVYMALLLARLMSSRDVLCGTVTCDLDFSLIVTSGHLMKLRVLRC